MGTRADFYIGRGKKAEWLGSIAWDGYPQGITTKNDEPIILAATTEQDYRQQLTNFFSERDDVTLPTDGWPWPWDDSQTTDYAYAFDEGRVWACPFGHGWFAANGPEPEEMPEGKEADFPNMRTKKNVQLGGTKSGLIVIQD